MKPTSQPKLDPILRTIASTASRAQGLSSMKCVSSIRSLGFKPCLGRIARVVSVTPHLFASYIVDERQCVTARTKSGPKLYATVQFDLSST